MVQENISEEEKAHITELLDGTASEATGVPIDELGPVRESLNADLEAVLEAQSNSSGNKEAGH